MFLDACQWVSPPLPSWRGAGENSEENACRPRGYRGDNPRPKYVLGRHGARRGQRPDLNANGRPASHPNLTFRLSVAPPPIRSGVAVNRNEKIEITMTDIFLRDEASCRLTHGRARLAHVETWDDEGSSNPTYYAEVPICIEIMRGEKWIKIYEGGILAAASDDADQEYHIDGGCDEWYHRPDGLNADVDENGIITTELFVSTTRDRNPPVLSSLNKEDFNTLNKAYLEAVNKCCSAADVYCRRRAKMRRMKTA